jgi:outer membrane protein OmpA-like peptidoglycan-associated protein
MINLSVHRAATAAALIVLLSAVLGACAPITKVVLLPQADGLASAVLVKTAKYEQLLSVPYQRVTAQEDKALKTDAISATEVQKAYPQLYASMPPRATKYVLNFMPGGTQLTPESQAQLPKILEDATSRSGADVVVTGHTDSTGALAANDTLSLSRAKVVAQLLVDKGAVASRLEAVGRGKRELLVPTADEVDEPQNRRVEIIVR